MTIKQFLKKKVATKLPSERGHHTPQKPLTGTTEVAQSTVNVNITNSPEFEGIKKK